jgi:hypothetical protein
MTRALVRLGRCYAGERSGEIPEGLLRYGRGGMKLAPWLDTIPLLIDHEEGKRIGRVDELIAFDDIDGFWLTARAELYPDVPAWVQKGTPASFKCALLNESTFVDGWVYGGLVEEVSLLQREKPAEPRAGITLLYEPAPTSMRSGRGSQEIVHPRGTILRRPTGKILGIR